MAAGVHACCMRRQADDRQPTRLRQFHETLPPLQQGVVITVLLANATVVVTADTTVMAAVLGGAIRGWRHRKLGLAAAARSSVSPVLCGVLAAALAAHAIEVAVMRELLRAVDDGRAAGWLERAERWLISSQETGAAGQH